MATTAFSLTTHPKMQFVQQRFRQIVDLSAEKVARHLENPGQYPMPASKKNIEHALLDVIKEVGSVREKKFRDRLKEITGLSSTARQQRFDELADTDLKKNKAVAALVSEIQTSEQYKLTPQEIKAIRAAAKLPVHKKAKPTLKTPRQAVTATNLDFFVDSLTCERTNDLRKDEISITGFATDAVGVNSEKAPFFVGEFKKGDTISLGANSFFFNFSVDNGSVGGEFPLTFIAGVIITEADAIKNKELGRKLAVLFSILFVVFVTAATAVLFFPAVPFAVAEAGFIAASISGILGHYVFPLLTDDFSDPVFDTLILDAPPAIGDTFTRTIDAGIGISILGGNKGKYKANVRWVVS